MNTPPRLSREVLRVFQCLPDLYLILSPELVVLTASDAYLRVAGMQREAIVGRALVDVLADHPTAPAAASVQHLVHSLRQVLVSEKPHRMAPQRHAVARTAELSGGFEARHWQCQNIPVLDEAGAVQYILHKAEAVTAAVSAPTWSESQGEYSADQEQKAAAARDGGHAALFELDENNRFHYIDSAAEAWPGQRLAAPTPGSSLQEIQQQLQESESLLRTAEAVGQLGSYEGDLATLRFRFSDNMFRLLGHEPQSLAPTLDWIDSFSNPNDVARIRQTIEEAVRLKQPYTYQRRIRRPDGQLRHIASRGVVVCDADGHAVRIVGTAQDITEQKQVEEALRESKLFIERIAQTTPHLLYLFEPAQNRLVYRNKALTTWLGYSADETAQLGERPFWLLLHPDDQAAMPLKVARVNALADGEVYASEVRLRAPDGSWRYLAQSEVVFERYPDGTVKTVLGTAEDVTAQKQAQAMIEENRQLLQAVFDAAPAGVAVFRAVRDADGRLLDLEYRLANAKLEKPMGRSLAGCRYGELFPDARKLGIFAAFEEVINTGQPADFELYYRGEQYKGWFRITAVKLEDGLVTSVEDITQRKQGEMELRQAYLEREQSNATIRQMLDGSLTGICMLEAVRDADERIVDFVFRGFNRAAEAVLNTPAAELLGRQLLQCFPVVGPRLFQDYKRVVETGEPLRVERAYNGQRGQGWFDVSGVVNGDGLILNVLDITARKKAEQTLVKQYQLQRQAEDVARLGSWEYNVATQAYHWSEGRYGLVGLPAGGPVTLDDYLADVVPDDQPLARQLVAAIRRGDASFEETLRVQVGGQVRALKVKATHVLDAEGRPLKVLGVDLDVSEIKRLESENLHMRLSQQQALLLAILEAQEEERRRVAESLHNGLGQLLTATKLNLSRVKSLLVGRGDTPPEALRTTEELLNESILETRRVSHELVPMILRDFGLAEAMLDLSRKYQQGPLRVHCEVAALPDKLESYLEVALYRISQELINNAVRHAGATQISLWLGPYENQLLLRVQDDGQGFDLGRLPAKGLGLRSIEHRVQLLNGRFSITVPETGRGTLVTVLVPQRL